MKILTNKSYECGFGFLKINASDEHFCYVEILNALYREMASMTNRHNKVLFVRFDLRLYEYTLDNKIMSDFMRKLKRWIKTHYQTNTAYLWVREQEKAKQQHYHAVLLIDGNKIRHPAKLNSRIIEMANQRGLSAFIPKSCYIMIKRDEPQTFANAFYRGSYLAKQRGKGYQGEMCKNYSASVVEVAGVKK